MGTLPGADRRRPNSARCSEIKKKLPSDKYGRENRLPCFTDYMAVNQKGKRKGLYLFTLTSNGVTLSVKDQGGRREFIRYEYYLILTNLGERFYYSQFPMRKVSSEISRIGSISL